MPAPEKTIVAKTLSKPSSKAAPSPPPQPQAVQVTISLPSITLDEKAKLKLPILFAILLFFSFSAIMFEKANFRTIDLFDLTRTEFNVAKAYSINFLLFLLLFSITLAIAMFYGQGLSPVVAGFTLPLLLIASLALGFLYPLLMLAFASIALAVSAVAISASFLPELTFKTAWSATGKATLLLVILAFLVVSSKVSSSKQVYEDTFFSTLTGAEALQPSNTTANPAKQFTKEDFNNTFTVAEVKAALAKIPGITSLNLSTQERFANEVKDALLTQEAFGRISSKAGSSTPAATTSSFSKADLMNVSGVKFFVNNLSTVAGLVAAALTLIAAFFLRLLSSIIAAALVKFVL